jgi:hypothetical protein
MKMGAAAARAEPDDQDGLFDQVIQNDVLAQALEKREKARLAKAKATKTYTEAHEAAKGQIDALGLDAETVVRCGRFRIRKSIRPGQTVSFDTSDTPTLAISPLE